MRWSGIKSAAVSQDKVKARQPAKKPRMGVGVKLSGLNSSKPGKEGRIYVHEMDIKRDLF